MTQILILGWPGLHWAVTKNYSQAQRFSPPIRTHRGSEFFNLFFHPGQELSKSEGLSAHSFFACSSKTVGQGAELVPLVGAIFLVSLAECWVSEVSALVLLRQPEACQHLRPVSAINNMPFSSGGINQSAIAVGEAEEINCLCNRLVLQPQRGSAASDYTVPQSGV